jgi:hypothetical protein
MSLENKISCSLAALVWTVFESLQCIVALLDVSTSCFYTNKSYLGRCLRDCTVRIAENLSLKLQLGYWDLVHCRTLLAVAERFVGVGCSLITSLVSDKLWYHIDCVVKCCPFSCADPTSCPADFQLLVGCCRLGGMSYVSWFDWSACMTPQKATLDSFQTLLWFVSYRRLAPEF